MELSPRDRALLSGMGVLFVGLALGGSIWWMDSREATLASKVEAHKQSVAVIKAHIDNFQQDSDKAATCEAKLVAHKGKSLNAFLSTLTDKQKMGDKDKISEFVRFCPPDLRNSISKYHEPIKTQVCISLNIRYRI